jgi:Brp/Blh family beta-carotene 15,15'-monooxygenase
MSITNKFAILMSFFALWTTMYFSHEHQQVLGFVVIFLLGLLHGANDLALYQKINENNKRHSFKKVLLYYIGVVALGALLFYSAPIIALLLFIIFSSYHFGEQHWNDIEVKNNDLWITIFQTTYGMFIFVLLFTFHEDEVATITYQITNASIVPKPFYWVLASVGLILIISGIKVNSISSKFKTEIILNVFYLFVFAVIFKTADLVWAFAIYFVFWHSIDSIKDQINYLYGDYNWKNFIAYFKSALPYWVLSIIGIVILYVIFKDEKIFNALFFSFLAAITFPHTIIIKKMQNDQ